MNNPEYNKMLKLWWERLRQDVPKEAPSLPSDLADLPDNLDLQAQEVEAKIWAKLDDLGIQPEDLKKDLPPEEGEPSATTPSPEELQKMITNLDSQTATLESDIQTKIKEAGVDLDALKTTMAEPAPSEEEALPKDPAELIKMLDQQSSEIESSLQKKLDELGIDLEELKKSPLFTPPSP